MLSVAVCDDNVFECRQLSQRVREILGDLPCAVTEFFSGKQLMESAQTFDIVLLDIMMEPVSGVAAADALRKAGRDFLLIFVTASKDYMPDAFDVEAFQYLVKPVEHGRLARALLAARAKLVPQAGRHLVYTKNGCAGKVDLDTVLYLESTGRVVKIHQAGKPAIEYYERFSALEGKLAESDFFRCHKSYLVNLRYVAHYHKTDVTLDDGTQIPLSKRRYQEFNGAMFRYLKKAGGIV